MNSASSITRVDSLFSNSKQRASVKGIAFQRLVYVSSCFVLFYGVVIAFSSRGGFPGEMQTDSGMPYLCDKPVGEDAYYMLTVAWNFAAGKGLEANEGLPVTGIQPLSTLVYSLISRVVQATGGDKWSLIRSVIVCNVLLLIAFSHFVGRIAVKISPVGRAASYTLAFGQAVLSFSVFRIFAYGLETGFYLLSLALLVNQTITGKHTRPLGEAVKLGLLAGVCGLCRIDFGLVFFVFLAASFLRRTLQFWQCAVAGLIAFFMVLPWFLWVRAVSHHWMPSSGTAQAKLISLSDSLTRIKSMMEALVDHLIPWIYSVSIDRIVVIEVITLIALLAAFVGFQLAHKFSSRRSVEFSNWIIALSILPPVYLAYFWASHFYLRYTSPLLVVTIPLIAVGLVQIATVLANRDVFVRVAYVAFAFSFVAFAYLSLHTGRIGNSHTVSAGFVQSQLPNDKKIGAFQSGVIGYFNDNVFNLDGKVNQRALVSLGDHSIERYLEEEQIFAIIDWPSYIDSYIRPDYLQRNWRKSKTQPNNTSVCYKYGTNE